MKYINFQKIKKSDIEYVLVMDRQNVNSIILCILIDLRVKRCMFVCGIIIVCGIVIIKLEDCFPYKLLYNVAILCCWW